MSSWLFARRFEAASRLWSTSIVLTMYSRIQMALLTQSLRIATLSSLALMGSGRATSPFDVVGTCASVLEETVATAIVSSSAAARAEYGILPVSYTHLRAHETPEHL